MVLWPTDESGFDSRQEQQTFPFSTVLGWGGRGMKPTTHLHLAPFFHFMILISAQEIVDTR
jgi:hypothetical protein